MDYREYLDKIVKEAQAIGKTVAEATKETADKAKTKIDIKRAEIERDKGFTSLGRIMYQIENGTLTRDDSIVGAACKRIADQEKLIEELKAKNAAAAEEAEKETEEAAEAEADAEEKVEEIAQDAAKAVEAAAAVEAVAEEVKPE